MLKAIAHGDDHELVILGLSEENIRRLKKNQPIVFDLDQLGIKNIKVYLFAGKDEDTMEKEIRDLIGPKTKKL